MRSPREERVFSLYKLLNLTRDHFKHYYRFRAVQSFVATRLQGVWGGTGYWEPTA